MCFELICCRFSGCFELRTLIFVRKANVLERFHEIDDFDNDVSSGVLLAPCRLGSSVSALPEGPERFQQTWRRDRGVRALSGSAPRGVGGDSGERERCENRKDRRDGDESSRPSLAWHHRRRRGCVGFEEKGLLAAVEALAKELVCTRGWARANSNLQNMIGVSVMCVFNTRRMILMGDLDVLKANIC